MTYITYITYIFGLNHVDNVVFPLILFFIPIHNIQQWQVALNFAEIALRGLTDKTAYMNYISYIGVFGAFFAVLGIIGETSGVVIWGLFWGCGGGEKKAKHFLNYEYR